MSDIEKAITYKIRYFRHFKNGHNIIYLVYSLIMSNVFISAHVVVTIAVKVLAGVTAAVSAARPNNLYTGNPRS